MNVVEQFKALAPVDNPSGREAGIRAVIADALNALGIAKETHQTVDTAGNLFVRVPGAASRETIMLSAHMDSVPPCEGIVPVDDTRDGRPIIRSEGRTVLGADDKAGIATILTVVSRLAASGFQANHPLELLFSTGEEVGLTGAKAFDMGLSKAAYCYVLDGEGRVGLVFNAGPSQENIRITCHGRASHAGIAPEAGISAIQMAAALAAALPSGRLADDLTCNLGTIEGGNAMNIVAPECTLRGEMRSHDEGKLSALLTDYRTSCDKVASRFSAAIDCESTRRYDAFRVDEAHPVVVRALETASKLNLRPQTMPMNIGSDAHILNTNGLPTIVLGMGFHYSHSLGEFIYCEELAQACEWVFQLVQ